MLLKLYQYLHRKKTVVEFGNLSALEPASRAFGLDRGTPVNRWYIERFLAGHADLVRGAVLEVGDDEYTRRFGGARVTRSDVLHAVAGNPGATLVGDLTRPDSLPAGLFDCFICTQTFDCIFDLPAAVAGAHRLLKPGGVLLATLSGIGQVSRYDMERWGDFWRFTPASAERLFSPLFTGGVEVAGQGNLAAAIAYLQGLAVEELPDRELLATPDDDYPVTVTVVARRA